MFNKIHFKIEFLISYFKKKYYLFLIGAIIGSAFFLSRNYFISLYNLSFFHTNRIGIDGFYTAEKLPENISQLISYGLTINSENNKPLISPLVKSLDIQNNNKDYIFVLNQNIKWHNNKKFTASDVDYKIKGITITPVSDYQLKISLENQFSPILSLLNKPFFKKNLIGLGSYKVKQVTYQKGYIKTLKLKPIDNKLSQLYYRFYSNEKDLINAFKIGEVDQIEISQLPQDFSQWHDTQISQNIQTNEKYSAIFLNTKKMENKQLRQALAYATPKTKDKNERCLGPISPNSWAYNPSVKEYAFNATRAKELFEKNKIEKINLSVNDRTLLPIAEEIKSSWQNILKINTTITIESQIDTQNFDALLTYGGIPHDPDQYYFWHSTQTNTNLTKLNNSRIDKLLEEGRQTLDPQERKRIYQDFQKFLLEESPAIFLSYPTTYTITRVK